MSNARAPLTSDKSWVMRTLEQRSRKNRQTAQPSNVAEFEVAKTTSSKKKKKKRKVVPLAKLSADQLKLKAMSAQSWLILWKTWSRGSRQTVITNP
jgi:hypothetical protein